MRAAAACALLLVLSSTTVQGQETTLSVSPAIVKPKVAVTVTAVTSRPTPPGARFRVSNATLLSTEKVSATTWLLSIGTTDPGLILIDCEHQDFLVGRTGIICAAQNPVVALQALAAIVGRQQPEARLVTQMQAALVGIVDAVGGNNIPRAKGQADRLAHLLITMPHHLLRHALLTPEANVLLASVFEFLIQLPFFQVPGPGVCWLAIERIWFNWLPGHVTEALELRHSYDHMIKRGYLDPESSEWVIGKTEHFQSPAAYAISTSKGRTLQIVARFIGTPLSLVVVQASDTNRAWGDVLERTVAIGPDGRSRPIVFDLSPRASQLLTIQRKDVEWRWRYKCIPQDIAFRDILNPITRHHIYIVLQPPQAPWNVALPDQRHNPWTDALDIAILRGAGATAGLETQQEAAEELTRYIHRRLRVKYDTRGGIGGAWYFRKDDLSRHPGFEQHPDATMGNAPRFPGLFFTDPPATRRTVERIAFDRITFGPVFHLSSFLSDARSQVREVTIQCYDLSAAMTSLANVVGVGMESRLMLPAGYINRLRIVGERHPSNNFFRDMGKQKPFISRAIFNADLTATLKANPAFAIKPDRVLPEGSTIDQGRSFYGNHAFNALNDRIYDSQFSLPSGALFVNLEFDKYLQRLVETTTKAQDLSEFVVGGRVLNNNAVFELR